MLVGYFMVKLLSVCKGVAAGGFPPVLEDVDASTKTFAGGWLGVIAYTLKGHQQLEGGPPLASRFPHDMMWQIGIVHRAVPGVHWAKGNQALSVVIRLKIFPSRQATFQKAAAQR